MSDLVRIISEDNIRDLRKKVSSFSAASGTNFQISSKKTYISLNNVSLLHVAAYYDAIECFLYLIEELGMPYDMDTAESYKPLHFACFGGSTEVISYILMCHPDEAKKETTTSYQYLFLSVVSGNSDAVRLLFNAGVDPNSKKNRENSPIRKAIELHLIDIIKILLMKSATNEGYNQDTALMFAIRRGEYEAVPLLLDAGEDASVFKTAFNKCECALQLACQQQNVESITAICQRLGPRINPNPKDPVDSYPVHWLCMSGKFEIARIILQFPINVNATDSNQKGGPSYLIGRSSGTSIQEKIAILDLLYEKGLDVNFTTGRKMSYLAEIITSLSCEIDLVKWYLQHDARTDIKCGATGLTIYEKAMKSSKLRSVFLEYAKV